MLSLLDSLVALLSTTDSALTVVDVAFLLRVRVSVSVSRTTGSDTRVSVSVRL